MRDELAQLHSDAFAWAMRCCRKDRAEAEDVLHEAYGKILDGRARFGESSTFKTWLFGVIRRTAMEQTRWRWLRLARLERWWERTQREELVDDTPQREADDRVHGLRNAMRRLSQRQQQVLHLVFYQELTIQEAAVVMEMPVGTARTHYERGKARLRQLLGASS